MTMFRKFLPLTLALALFGLALTGCEEDVLGGDEAAMKAEVDGDDWEATSVTAVGSSTIVIDAARTQDDTGFRLQIPSDATVGKHDLPSTDGFRGAYKVNASTIVDGTNGSITIKAISETQVSGTFEFDIIGTSSTIEIEDGSFVANRN